MASTRMTNSIHKLYGKIEDRYLDLIRRFPLRPLRSDSELDSAIEVIDSLIDRDKLSAPERDYLDVLSGLVKDYEEEAVAIKSVSDSEMIRFLIEAKQVTQSQVAAGTGIAESTVSAVLAGKRKLNRNHIGKLAKYFHVSTAVFAD